MQQRYPILCSHGTSFIFLTTSRTEEQLAQDTHRVIGSVHCVPDHTGACVQLIIVLSLRQQKQKEGIKLARTAGKARTKESK